MMTCTQRTHDCDIRPAASAVKASGWKQFGFCEVEGKQNLDQSHTTCKMCQTKLKDHFTSVSSQRRKINSQLLLLPTRQPSSKLRKINMLSTELQVNSESAAGSLTLLSAPVSGCRIHQKFCLCFGRVRSLGLFLMDLISSSSFLRC